MSKAKINFELDERVLAQAQAYASENRTSLSKLVSAFFAGLGQKKPALARSAMDKTLTEFAVGKVSMADAARELGLQDAGFLMEIMREKGLPLPALDPFDVNEMAQRSFGALKNVMRPAPLNSEEKGPSRGKRTSL